MSSVKHRLPLAYRAFRLIWSSLSFFYIFGGLGNSSLVENSDDQVEYPHNEATDGAMSRLAFSVG